MTGGDGGACHPFVTPLATQVRSTTRSGADGTTKLVHVTVVVAVKVFDGVVVAADSATTMPLANGSHQVYNNANKIFQLHRKYPIAAATWGMAAIGSASIATLSKELRRRLMGGDAATRPDWKLDDTYTVKGVAERLLELVFDELYSPLVTSGQWQRDELGFAVFGFSGGDRKAEVWTIHIDDPTTRPVPRLEANGDQFGWGSYAIRDASERLFHGYDPQLPMAIKAVTNPAEHAAIDAAFRSVYHEAAPPVMPMADAIELARFLATVTVGYARFIPGPDIVGGPIEVACLTRFEGFKCVSRKHYYSADLNPENPHHDF